MGRKVAGLLEIEKRSEGNGTFMFAKYVVQKCKYFTSPCNQFSRSIENIHVRYPAQRGAVPIRFKWSLESFEGASLFQLCSTIEIYSQGSLWR